VVFQLLKKNYFLAGAAGAAAGAAGAAAGAPAAEAAGAPAAGAAAGAASAGAGAAAGATGAGASFLPQAAKETANKEAINSDFFIFISLKD
jgi:hypothetical protein